MNDPEDDQPEPQLGRKFTFQGKPLADYSWNHRAALQRLGSLTDYEFCAYLVRLLQMDEREVDAIRTPEQMADFRIATGKWADAAGVSRSKGLEQLQALVDEIIGAVNAAEDLQAAPNPDAKKKQGKPSSPPAKRRPT